MNKHNNNPSVLVELRRGKDTKNVSKTTQIKTIFEYLKKVTTTASMVSEATGIPQKNITRYKRDLEKNNRLWEVEKKTCKRTGFKAWYLTTNPEFAPSINQLKLF